MAQDMRMAHQASRFPTPNNQRFLKVSFDQRAPNCGMGGPVGRSALFVGNMESWWGAPNVLNTVERGYNRYSWDLKDKDKLTVDRKQENDEGKTVLSKCVYKRSN
jgi:hypothetical protein